MERFGSGGIVSIDRLPRYLIAFGAILATVLLGEIVGLLAVDSGFVFDGRFLIGVVSTVPFLIGIVAAGLWLRRADLSPGRYPRIGWWCLGGVGCFLVFNAVLVPVVPTESGMVVFSWMRWAVAVGAGIGLLIGCIEAKAIERALTVERALVRADHLEDQRDYLDWLNSILRHEVLNTAAIIGGYARRLRDETPELDDRRREWVELIIDESEELSTVIDDVRVLLRAANGEGSAQLEPVNASRMVADELRKLETRFEVVETEASIPEGVFVVADELLGRVFANLLMNAVEHNDAAMPRVSVTVEPGPETHRFEITDNGPGVPDDEFDSLFDRGDPTGSTHGLGLYLVEQLVTRYEGTVEVCETGPDGTTFAVELPAADVERSQSAVPTSSSAAPSSSRTSEPGDRASSRL